MVLKKIFFKVSRNVFGEMLWHFLCVSLIVLKNTETTVVARVSYTGLLYLALSTLNGISIPMFSALAIAKTCCFGG